jgi:hypothetical protein
MVMANSSAGGAGWVGDTSFSRGQVQVRERTTQAA